MNILVTGGAGFIGSHLVDALVERGHRVRVLDNLEPQVHGPDRAVPAYLNREAELIVGDVTRRDEILCALDGVEVVFHEAAVVGVGQSMYEVRRYMYANTIGTATLLDVLANEKHQVRKLVVASSMSAYGEGAYDCQQCGQVFPDVREEDALAHGDWEMKCPNCGRNAEPRPTLETKPLGPTSPYAISKRDQEELCLAIGRAYDIPTVALRYFNVYGPRQALSNPYTGVAAIFISRMLNGQPPIIFEDGLQSRDFVHVSDIVQANLLAMTQDAADYHAINVGSGQPITILDVARALGEALGFDSPPIIEGKFRAGDIRHCFSDISQARRLLGYEPKVAPQQGLANLALETREETPADLLE
ncbi:MAG: NAD-dependent epimerase/dehydratase family protein, partial [Armatimonadota bacterium]